MNNEIRISDRYPIPPFGGKEGPGIYIHIPFCKQACYYCDFHFSTSLKAKDDLVDALVKEIQLQKDYAGASAISTIYFGGGTPSLLSADELKRILNEVGSHFAVEKDAEITLEANPDDLDKEKLYGLKAAGINRLSIGIQSFADEDLKLMNRAHNSKQAHECVLLAADAGFGNITIDLIYGIQTLSNEQWMQNLETAFALPINHLSSYALTVEERTALADFIKKGKYKNVEDEKTAQQFELLMKMTAANGFEQYEISNFAKNQHYSRHNSNYWRGDKYLGIGPSAHSYNGESRQWNVRNNSLYIAAIKNGNVPFEQETLTPSQRYNEYIMVSLRTMWGVNLEKIRKDFGGQAAETFYINVSKYIAAGFIETQRQNFILTQKGKLFADRIAGELFL